MHTACPAAPTGHPVCFAGRAVTFFTEDDMPRVKKIANIIVAAGGEVPPYISDFKEAIHANPRPKQAAVGDEANRKRRRPV